MTTDEVIDSVEKFLYYNGGGSSKAHAHALATRLVEGLIAAKVIVVTEERPTQLCFVCMMLDGATRPADHGGLHGR